MNTDFVDAVNAALSDLARVQVTLEELKKALLSGGSPMTVQDIKARFESFLQEKSRGKDPGKIRIILE